MQTLNIDTSILIALLLCLGAYALGSISSAVLICRAMGYPDPRLEGSNNPGATNVMRLAGKGAAAITLLSDVIKGIPAILIGLYLGMSPAILSLIGMAAFLGHLYPVFFRFQGGKGVATAFGIIFMLSWKAGLIVGSIWLLTFALFRISALSSILSWLCAPITIGLISPDYFFGMAIMSFFLIYRHKQNITDLMSGSIFANEDDSNN